MKIVIAEDDLTSRKVLSHFTSMLPSYEIVGEAKNGEELIRHVVACQPDVAIVDIQMPLINGMDAIKACRVLCPNLQVIFITGNEDYAVEAFGISAADYIIKPIEFERFKQALERASNIAKANQTKTNSASTMSPKNNEKKLVLNHYNSITIIPFDEILFIEKVERKTYIHTKTKVYQNSLSLTELLNDLSADFVHSHRSYIVNVHLITNIESHGQTYYAYFLNYKEPAKVSKHQIKQIKHILNKHG